MSMTSLDAYLAAASSDRIIASRKLNRRVIAIMDTSGRVFTYEDAAPQIRANPERFYTLGPFGSRAYIEAIPAEWNVHVEYLRTRGNAYGSDNLDNLPDC